MENKKNLSIGMIALMIIVILNFPSTEGDSEIFGPPTRNDDLTMDMNISEASMASFWGESTGDTAGWPSTGVGDVNGDGFDDILIGACYNDQGGFDAGKAYLIFGKSSNWVLDTNLSTADASFIGEDAGDNAGWSVSGAGDVNGDGYDDILIGADMDEEGDIGAGQTYLFFGKSSGWALNTNLSTADASFLGEIADDRSGIFISGAGDVNGDGYDDILIGADWNDDGGSDAGQTYLIFGKTSGWSMDTDLSTADASFIGEEAFDLSGETVTGLGDVNGDGYDDILIGAYYNDEGGADAGQTYLIFGRSSGWAMDTDLSNSDASFWGELDSDMSIGMSRAGDVNKDGYNDILIGAPSNDESGLDAGQTYLIFGKDSGWAMDTDLSNADASFTGESAGDGAGIFVSGAGDLNADGYDEILIGAYNNDEGGYDAGQTYLIYGKATDWAMDTNLSTADASFIGEKDYDWSGNYVSSGGDVNGDGSDDILISAHSNDEGGIDAGQSYLISGSGFSEPLEIYSIVVRNSYNDEVTRADKKEMIQVEIFGLDSNKTRIDRARANISFSKSLPVKMTISLLETGINTGIYRGNFIIPARTQYFEKLRFSAYIDQSKYYNIIVDYPFRPSSVYSIGVYSSLSGSTSIDKLDIDHTGYFKCTGLDTNPFLVDKAFVNLTSDKNVSFRPMIVLTETGQSTGIYVTAFIVPNTMEYFENITLTSSETPAITTKFMIHTPVQIRAKGHYQTAVEDIEYIVEFYNFGYNPVTWSLSTNASWLSWDDPTRTLHGTPRNNDVGDNIWDVELMIEDDDDNTNSIMFPIKVFNAPPHITNDPIIDCLEKELYYLDMSCDDDGQGDITWYLYTDSPFLDIDKSTGILQGTPIMGDEGEYLVNVQVQDGNGGSDNLIFNLTVLGKNDRPRITTTDIKQIEQGTPFRRDYDVFDPDEGDTHNWTLRTDAGWLSMENETGVLSGTPDGYDVGEWLVNITVSDKGGLSDYREFILNVLDKKDKPIWLDVPESIELLHGTIYNFDVNATDPDREDILTYSLQTDPEVDMRINPKTGQLGWTANYRSMPALGQSISVTLKVSDGELFILHEFAIKVLPTLSPTTEMVSPAKGARTLSTHSRLEWKGTDPENEPLTYTLYLADSESYVMAKRSENIIQEGITETFYNLTGLPTGKTYFWMVIPDDGCTRGTCTCGVFNFRINSRPILKTVEAQSAQEGKEFRLKLGGSDADQDDTLSYELIDGPSGVLVKADTAMVVWTPKGGQVGVHTVKVRVTDGFEHAEQSFEIEVTEAETSSLGMMIGLVIGALVLVIMALIIYLFVFKGRSDRKDREKEKEREEAERIQEQIEQNLREKEWEQSHYAHIGSEVSLPEKLISTGSLTVDPSKKKNYYEELYGNKASIDEGKKTISKQGMSNIKGPVSEPSNIGPPEKGDEFLEDLITHAPKKISDIESHGLPLEPEDMELRSVDDPYDHFGETEDEIKK